MGKKSRTKGAAFERLVAKISRALFPNAERNLDQYQKKDGKDLKGVQPFSLQCKRRESAKLWEIKMGYVEAKESATVEYYIPIVVWQDDFGEIMCMLRYDHLIEFGCGLEDGTL